MADDNEFHHLVKNSKKILKLSAQYENHPYAEEFTKYCNVAFVYGTYLLEDETDAKFSLGNIWNTGWNLFQEDPLPNNNFCRQMINCMRAWNYLQKISGLPLNTEIIKEICKIMMDGNEILTGEYRKSPAFAGYHIFGLAGHIERYMEDAIFRFHETKKDDPIMAATNLLGNIINIHPFEDGNGRICCLILAHVLIHIKCCLFLVILSSFHRRGRRQYIRAVKTFDGKLSMLYTMILKSLIHCWDNFEQNAKMLTHVEA